MQLFAPPKKRLLYYNTLVQLSNLLTHHSHSSYNRENYHFPSHLFVLAVLATKSCDQTGRGLQDTLFSLLPLHHISVWYQRQSTCPGNESFTVWVSERIYGQGKLPCTTRHTSNRTTGSTHNRVCEGCGYVGVVTINSPLPCVILRMYLLFMAL